MRLSITIAGDVVPYMEAGARLRRTSVTNLVRRIVDAVLRDQMVLAILDDEDDVVQKSLPKVPKPSTHVTRARASVVQRPNAQTFSFKKQAVKTREELRRELEEAVRNTAELPVE